MAEAIADADAGKKRRLPVWMVRANPENEPKKHVEGDRSRSLSEEKPEVKDAGSKLNSTTKMLKIKTTRSIDSLSKSDTDKSSKARQRKRKASRRNVVRDDDDSLTNRGIAKTGREEDEGGLATVDNGAAAETKRRRSKRPKHDEVVCSPVCDNEIELTVEDLVRIAEEYVNADKRKQLECSTASEHRSEVPPKTSSGSSGVSTAGSPQVSGLNQALSRCTTIPTPDVSASNLYEEKNPEADIPVTRFSQTGDAAQDMLDLLLGPLLKKTKFKEHERRAVNAESMTLTHKPNKPSTISSEVCKDEALPTKRKSSLKDKVAMLLDD